MIDYQGASFVIDQTSHDCDRAEEANIVIELSDFFCEMPLANFFVIYSNANIFCDRQFGICL